MNPEQIREQMQEAGGGAAYIDLADEGCFILDGSFTLAEIAALGDVARRAMQAEQNDTSPGETLGPKAGDTIRVTTPSSPFYRIGDYAKLVRNDGDFWQADFNDPRNTEVYGQGLWAIGAPRFEVIR